MTTKKKTMTGRFGTRRYNEPKHEERDRLREKLARDYQEWLGRGNAPTVGPSPGYAPGGRAHVDLLPVDDYPED